MNTEMLTNINVKPTQNENKYQWKTTPSKTIFISCGKKMVGINLLLKRQLPFEWIVLPEAIARRPENLQWVEAFHLS